MSAADESTVNKICDFARSFVSFTTQDHVNTARLQLEARCVFMDESGAADEYLLFASCKAEETYGPGALFRIPNYDFCGIFGPEEYALIRAHVIHDQRYAEIGRIADRFAEVSRHMVYFDRTETLTSPRAAAEATFANHPLVGRTELSARDGEVRALVEFPIKTMNAHLDPDRFQVDTGPILLPDVSRPEPDRFAGFQLAFVAFNQFQGAEFIIQRPTPVVVDGRTVALVNHYSETKTMDSTNEVIVALPADS